MQVQQNKGKLQDASFIPPGSASPVGDLRETAVPPGAIGVYHYKPLNIDGFFDI
jgi:hypothetical protein